jgi:hypothetical protein
MTYRLTNVSSMCFMRINCTNVSAMNDKENQTKSLTTMENDKQ